MADSPLTPTPYEVLGVDPSASQDDLRRAYRRLARETHPDLGGAASKFHAVQLAWEQIGEPDDRAAYDRGAGSTSFAPGARDDADRPRARAESSTVRARSYGHPGGLARERYLELIREWAGRGVTLDDPYDPAVVRSAPAEIRRWLAEAKAEESTARTVAELGIGYTIWSDVVSPRGGASSHTAKIDHIVLGPTGLFAIQSQDWGSEVRIVKGEVVASGLARDEQPFAELYRGTKSIARAIGVRFTALIIVVPDDALAEPVLTVDRGRHQGATVVRRSVLPHLLRTGLDGGVRSGVGEVFEVRTRLQAGIRFV